MRVTCNNVLVKKRPVAETENVVTSSGLITEVKQNASGRQAVKADVVAIGDDVKGVKVGDVINLFNTHFTHEFYNDGLEYALTEEKFVLYID